MGRLKKAMEAIVYWHGKVSDTNYIWFPYLFLKPAPSESISLIKSTFIMAPLWGLYMGLPYGLYFMYSQGWSISDTGLLVAKFGLFFVFWFNIVTRPLWNSRAKQIQSKQSNN